METQVWVLGGVAGFLVAVLLLLFRVFLQNMGSLKTLINEIRMELVKQNEQLKTLFNKAIDQKEKVDRLEGRVAEVEREIYSKRE
ncbi:hypothetical protein FUAX_40890 (plasmid) [Fulvitalea axinellae]|uniref:Uncharacterized protein n=1 Tax=Fulvitalea axinellae TaxID=1182444 RepID=A0AAU9CX82_9BACT|nr:hypothetical protein FUAX_40890 [Fulvitalea axinellae]